MTAAIAVWPHPRVLGWDGRPETLPHLDGWPVVDLLAALLGRWPTDAHAPGYAVPGDDPKIPRLQVAALSPLIDAGAEPVMVALFIDVDRPDHAPWSTTEEAAAEVDALLDRHGDEGGALEAAGVYTTRAGFRLVFRPDRPVPVAGFKAFMRGNDGDGGFLGWLSRATGIPVARDGSGGIDPTCAEWSRCFRLPFVVRDGRTTDPHVDLARLVARALRWHPSTTPTRQVPAPATGSAHDGYSAGIPPLPELAEVDASMWAKLADHPVTARYLEKMRTGTPLAGKGSRDTALISVVGAVVRALGSRDPLDAWRVIARSVAADNTEGAPTMTKAWEKCRHFAQREVDRSALAATVANSPPIVYSGSRYYVLDSARCTYRAPVSAVALCALLENGGPPGVITRSATGKPLDTAEFLADYGRPAVHVIAEMGRERTEYDPTTNGGTLLEACCRVRADVVAVHHADVDTWLRHLGGPSADVLLDWLATVIDVEHPTCALYLEGAPSAGKGMFVAGIAALWGAGATSYADATGAFNGALAVCPIVHVDEGVATNGRDVSFSAAFRTLTGESVRPLRRKFMETATIVGCPRVVITANNADAMRIRERLTAPDLEAIALRILHVRSPDAAGKKDASVAGVYLESIGGRVATAEWVTRAGRTAGKLAEHVLWLRANRAVAPGSRFLVQGTLGNFHRDMALTSGINGDLLACLATVIERGGRQAGIEWGAGTVRVNAPAVRRVWSAALQSTPPSDSEIANALAALATGTERIRTPAGRLRYYILPGESVERIAETLQIGDPDVLAARIAAPLVEATSGVVVPLRPVRA